MNTKTDIVLLLVEDDDIDAEGIKRSFAKRNIPNRIVRANDGLEALELIESDGFKQPYVILLDLNMPRMCGIDFLKTLRQNPKHSKAVVFVLTTSSAEQDVVAAYNQNIAGYFVKSEMGSNYFNIANLFDNYSKIVKLPNNQMNAM